MRTTFLFFMVLITISCKKNTTETPAPQVSSIRFENPEERIILGNNLKLNIAYEPGNAIKPNYEWRSSNPDILSITDEGIIHAKSIGIVRISAGIKNTNLYITHTIEVIPDFITSIVVEKTDINLSVQQQQKINISLFPLTASSAGVKWTSSDPSIAQVTSSGLITGLSAGKAIITVTSSNSLATAKINIEVLPDINYSITIFNNLKTNLLDQLILYNEQQGKALGQELKAGKIGYIVLAKSAIDESYMSSNPGYPEAMFSKLKIPSGDVIKINSNFYFELFPNTSRMGTLTLDINFFEKSWEIKGTRTKPYSYSYSYNVTLAELKAIIDENISDVRRYVTTGSY